jgi:uncharacterized protein (DUF983 family)
MKIIVLTDPPEIPKDERCPRCDAGKLARQRSMTFGPLHDVCGVCGHDFDELTVPATDEDEVM